MILHIDMDAFFASVEQLDNPGLRSRCVLVGKGSGRGVVAAASYEARKYGVQSAMPVTRALRLCPAAVVISPRMERYKEVSEQVMNILSTISPLVEQVSIDEAYIDISGCQRLLGTPEAIARAIKDKVRGAIGITCSVGGAPLKFLAKIASDMNKPDGLTIISPETMLRFIETLAIEKVPGVGQVTRDLLALLGIKTLGDVARCPEDLLMKKMGKFGARLIALSHGKDDAAVVPWSQAKSVSTETTLSRDTTDPVLLKQHLLRQSARICRELLDLDAKARVLFIKIKYADFSETSRQITLDPAIASSDAIYQQAVSLLEKQKLPKKVRLIGVGLTGLVFKTTGVQMELFNPDNRRQNRWEKVDRSVSAITEKFGENAIKRGSLTE
ncbi:MAG: DNA polymerase IV [Thermodesulfobacteriota bacterium]